MCPSHIPLTQYFRYAKAEITHQDVARERADLSRVRFEQRNERIARQAAERAERIAAKKRAAREKSAKQDPKKVIDDVMARVAERERATDDSTPGDSTRDNPGRGDS